MTMEEKIMNTINKEGSLTYKTFMAEHTDLKDSSVRVKLCSMKKNGVLTNVERGVYKLK